MKNKMQIKAFSILEAVVSMAIAAIVIGLAFVIFSIITERLLDYKSQNQLVNDLNRFTYSINKDAFDSDELKVKPDQLVFEGYSGERVTYSIEEKEIIRYKEEFADTFKITLREMAVDSVKSKSGRLVFQKLKLKMLNDSVVVDVNFYKPVFANQLLSKKFLK